jgi:hypothetical protein
MLTVSCLFEKSYYRRKRYMESDSDLQSNGSFSVGPASFFSHRKDDHVVVWRAGLEPNPPLLTVATKL